MMKTIMIATTALVSMTSFAVAEVPALVGYSEYAVEGETFELGVGTELNLANGLTITPMIVAVGEGSEFAFDHAEVKASYTLNANVSLYGKVTSDADFNYAETTLGASFQF